MKIVIAGEMYSSNLGDRLIYDTLRHLFLREKVDLQIVPLDISGRSPTPPAGENKSRQAQWIRLAENRFPGLFSLLNAGVQLYRARKRASSAWRQAFAGADALVIGGGQLLQDNQLGFPVKLYSLVRAAKKHNLAVFFCACGVGERWSPLAQRLFGQALSQAQAVSLRDPLSQQRMAEYLPHIQTTLAFDPAIWAQDVYGPQPPASERVGLGVISHLDVNLHLPPDQRMDEETWLAAWAGVLLALDKQNQPVVLFSNGSPLDQSFAARLAEYARQAFGLHVPLAPRPTTVKELVSTLTSHRGIAAFRMHANILADAYRIPVMGMVWDQKVRAYYTMRGVPQRAIDFIGVPPGEFVQAMQAAIHEGIDIEGWLAARQQACMAVQQVLSHLAG